jgi:hypothetical protein
MASYLEANTQINTYGHRCQEKRVCKGRTGACNGPFLRKHCADRPRVTCPSHGILATRLSTRLRVSVSVTSTSSDVWKGSIMK